MPRLVKGAKWASGLVVVGLQRELLIPLQAWREFQFRAGGEALFVPGSRRSGGFSLSTPALMTQVSERLEGCTLRVLARGHFGEGRVVLPPEVGTAPGDVLLAGRYSGVEVEIEGEDFVVMRKEDVIGKIVEVEDD